MLDVRRFHESFRRRADGSQTLESFFRGYRPPITARHHTCVGLGLDLMERILALRSHYPDIASALFLSSCEEVNSSSSAFQSTPHNPVKPSQTH